MAVLFSTLGNVTAAPAWPFAYYSLGAAHPDTHPHHTATPYAVRLSLAWPFSYYGVAGPARSDTRPHFTHTPNKTTLTQLLGNYR